jgi:hypothetical protein
MKKLPFMHAWLLCLLACGPYEGDSVSRYNVRNDTTVAVSLYAMSADTTLAFTNIEPTISVQVAYDCQLGANDIRFFLSDSVLVKRGDSVLDTYYPWDTTRDMHIMVRADYELTKSADADREYTFGLFTH